MNTPNTAKHKQQPPEMGQGTREEEQVEKSLSDHWGLFQVRLLVAKRSEAKAQKEIAGVQKTGLSFLSFILLLFCCKMGCLWLLCAAKRWAFYVTVLTVAHLWVRGQEGEWMEVWDLCMLPCTWCNSLGCEWNDVGRGVGGKHGRMKIVLVSVMLMMPDISVPLGISSKH